MIQPFPTAVAGDVLQALELPAAQLPVFAHGAGLRLTAEIIAHHEDAGVSGAFYESRSGIQAAIRDIETGRADVLIVYNVSRLSRDREHQSAIKKRVELAGGSSSVT